MSLISKKSFGIVDWFGGENKKTGRLNNFGFLTTLDEQNVFVHRKCVKNGELCEGDVVICSIMNSDSGKLSANCVHKIDAIDENSVYEIVSVLKDFESLELVVSNVHTRKLVISLLGSKFSGVFINEVGKSDRGILLLSELIRNRSKHEELFEVLVGELSIKDVLKSGIPPSHIPNGFIVKNFESIYSYWDSIGNNNVKLEFLINSVKKLSRSSNLLSSLVGSLSKDRIFEIIDDIRNNFNIHPLLVTLLNKNIIDDIYLERYLSGKSLRELDTCKIKLDIIPANLLKGMIKSELYRMAKSEDYNSFSTLSISTICKVNLLEFSIFDISDEMKFTVISRIKKSCLYDGFFLRYVEGSNRCNDLVELLYCQDDIKTSLDNGFPIDLLPKDYLDKQITELLADIQNPKINENQVNGQIVRLALKHVKMRHRAIKLIKQAHITNYSDIIDCLTELDLIVVNSLHGNALNYEIKYDDVEHVLPLLNGAGSFQNSFYATNHIIFLEWLSALEESDKVIFYRKYLSKLDINAQLSFIFSGVVGSEHLTGGIIKNLEEFVYNVVNRKDTGVKPFVRDVYRNSFGSVSEFKSHTVIKPFYDKHYLLIVKKRIKAKAYNYDMSFVLDIESSEVMKEDPELWFLWKLLPLIIPENSYDSISAVILHEIWTALLNGELDINHPSIFKLFPQCITLLRNFPHMKLSCESFYWKRDIDIDSSESENFYLCRSRRCVEPKVIGDSSKHIDEFSIYDWLSHYGVSYSHFEQPSKHDFAIKLSGYLNRIRELHSRLNCRSCNRLMIPNMNYARVEIVKVDPNSGNRVVIPVKAAYRLTVFKCNCKDCSEYNIGYYINHCIGHKCYEIIDSRDNSRKCKNGRYVCNDEKCNSCCSSCAEKSPIIHSQNIRDKHKNIYNLTSSYKVLKS